MIETYSQYVKSLMSHMSRIDFLYANIDDISSMFNTDNYITITEHSDIKSFDSAYNILAAMQLAFCLGIQKPKSLILLKFYGDNCRQPSESFIKTLLIMSLKNKKQIRKVLSEDPYPFKMQEKHFENINRGNSFLTSFIRLLGFSQTNVVQRKTIFPTQLS